MLRVLLPLLAIGLMVYALADLLSSDERQRGGIPKALWLILIVLLPFLGPIAWILVRRSATRGPGGSGGSLRPGRRHPGPVAPDDDPEFLWRLEQQQRRQARENGEPGTGTQDRDGDTHSTGGDGA